MSLLIQTKIEPEDVMINNDYDEIHEFILRLDLMVADAEFTEALVKKLMTSLRKDLDRSEYDELLNFLK